VRIAEPSDGPITSIGELVDLPVGSIGEIIVQGDSVTRGYDYLPEADADSKILDDARYWHRMGDMGWLDDSGRLWFCGRKVERVLTDAGAMYTDCCEAIFNTHPWVYRSALIDLCQGRPAIVIEPEKAAFPKSTDARARFIESLRELGRKNARTVLIKDFFFEANFPVDVRHNAKIHRLSLARKFALK
jgi:acyl-CoA synthetase (AMP-forming)/AMP-acid ligase II